MFKTVVAMIEYVSNRTIACDLPIDRFLNSVMPFAIQKASNDVVELTLLNLARLAVESAAVFNVLVAIMINLVVVPVAVADDVTNLSRAVDESTFGAKVDQKRQFGKFVDDLRHRSALHLFKQIRNSLGFGSATPNRAG